MSGERAGRTTPEGTHSLPFSPPSLSVLTWLPPECSPCYGVIRIPHRTPPRLLPSTLSPLLSLMLLQTNNDPSAGSPTETLLRLLLPLDAGARGVSVHAERVLQTTRRNIQSVGATGGVYKGQGRIQHAITNTCLRGIPSSRPIVARDDPNQDGASQGCRFISELASTYCSRHCSTRAAQ